MTDTLLAFLRARLDEDEATARAASGGPWRAHTGPVKPWQSRGELIHPVYTWDRPVGAPVIMTAMWADSAHIAYHHPERVLADVEAARVLIAQYEGLVDAALDGFTGVFALAAAIRAKATVYAEHPDYDESWRP
ncbi:DUF6221 family protein [Streptomyces sp. NPDC001054]